MKRICTICARAGSKGAQNKNIRPLLEKPLITYSIEHALASKLFDSIAVSSDSLEILAIAGKAGATELVERPSELASDTAPKIPAIRHCVQTVESREGITFDTLVDLDATSPLRSVEDIRAAMALMESDAAVQNVITAASSRRSPYFNLVELDADGTVMLCKPSARGIARRQDAPPCYDMNASFYVWRHDTLFSSDTLFLPKTKLFVMPEVRSLDIDSELDFEIVELIMKKVSVVQL